MLPAKRSHSQQATNQAASNHRNSQSNKSLQQGQTQSLISESTKTTNTRTTAEAKRQISEMVRIAASGAQTGGKMSSDSHRRRSSGSSLSLVRLIGLVLVVGQLATLASSWRIFDTADSGRYSSNMMMPQMVNSMPANQLLMPAMGPSMLSQSILHQQHQQQQQLSTPPQQPSLSSPERAPISMATEQTFASNQIAGSAGGPSASLDASSKEQHSASDSAARDASSLDSSPSANNNAIGGAGSPLVTSATTMSMSPAGKILDAIQATVVAASAEHASAAGGSSSGSSSKSSSQKSQQNSISTSLEKLASIEASHSLSRHQLLRPRKHGEQVTQAAATDGSKHQLASMEQQIINQHAKAQHSSTGSHHHQRLLPTKQRDQKIINALFGDSSGSNSGNSNNNGAAESPLYTLLGNLKSGVTSRSSIVKAISDNKLARTLSTVSKSISGNKYIAGAAAASALAALGLTMTKLLSPYLFAGGYSKLGDPMMSAGSFQSTLMSPDRTNSIIFTNPADPIYTSASSQQSATNWRPTFGGNQPQSPQLGYTLNPFGASAGDPLQYDSSIGYPTSAVYPPTAYTPTPSGAEQYYIAYSPRPAIGPAQGGQSLSAVSMPTGYQLVDQPAQQQAKKAVFMTDTDGHYTNYYSQQGVAEQDPYSSSSSAATAPYAQPSPSSSGIENNGGSVSSAGDNGGGSLMSASSTVGQYENLMPEASNESPIYAQQQQQQSGQSRARQTVQPQRQMTSNRPTSRRSGPIKLKMNEATRARLNQQVAADRQRQQQQLVDVWQPDWAAFGGASGSGGQAATASEYVTRIPIKSSKSSRVEPNGYIVEINGAQPALPSRNMISAGNGLRPMQQLPQQQGQQQRQQQQQQQASKTNGPAYFIIRPKVAATVAEPTGSSSTAAGDTRQQLSPGAASFGSATAAAATSAWRSLGDSSSSSDSVGSPSLSAAAGKQLGWQSVTAAPSPPRQATSVKQPATSGVAVAAADDQLASAQQQPDSSSATRSRLAAATNGQQQQQQQHQEQLLHRVSRTPSHSSVKANGARHPIESLTDYESETLNGAAAVAAASGTVSSGVVRVEPSSASSSLGAAGGNGADYADGDGDSGKQQVTEAATATAALPGREGLPAASAEDDLSSSQGPLTLRQLTSTTTTTTTTTGDDGENNDNKNNSNNNVIKLIEANASGEQDGSARSSSAQLDSAGGSVLIMLPSRSTRSQQQQGRHNGHAEESPPAVATIRLGDGGGDEAKTGEAPVAK